MSDSNKMYVFGKQIYNFYEAASLVEEHEVLFIDFDDADWYNVGVWLTPSIVDDMYNKVNNQTYLHDCYVIDPVIVRNNDVCKLKKGKHQFTSVNRIDNKLQKH